MAADGRLAPRTGEVGRGQAGALEELFAGRHFDREVIMLAFAGIFGSTELRDLVEMMAERGLSLAHTTIMRWVQHYTPESKSAGTVMPFVGGHGVSTKHTSRSEACGTICIVPWTGRANGRLQAERQA